MTDTKTNKANTKGKRCSLDIPGLGLVDGRTQAARHYGALVIAIADDIGGIDEISNAERELVRRAAGLSVLATVAEAKLLNGDEIDTSELVSVGNAQRRILTTLGLKRVPRDITPDLQTYLAATEGKTDGGP